MQGGCLRNIEEKLGKGRENQSSESTVLYVGIVNSSIKSIYCRIGGRSCWRENQGQIIGADGGIFPKLAD